MNIGIIGAGWIANKMAKTVKEMKDASCYAIAARDLDRAKAFAKEYDFQVAYGSYEELVRDENVELIYVATPHPYHFDHAKLALEHKKPVLCEKPFTVNAKETKELLEIAAKNNVFITEAIWTRYMPSRKTIDEIIARGEIGDVVSLTANLGYDIAKNERVIRPELAGGALLDVGVYAVNFATQILGYDIEEMHSTCVKSDTGVDLQNSMIFKYKNGTLATLHSGATAATEQHGIIYGTKGYIIADEINNITEIKVYDKERNLVKDYPVMEQITGFEYQVEDSMEAIKNNKLECEAMTHEETIKVMEIMDQLREDWGIKYPFE